MSITLQSQILTSIQLGPHTYHVLDLHVEVDGEEIPILKDETGRLCIFSRLLSKVAGYKQKDTLFRTIQRQESKGLLQEGLTHRMISTNELQTLCTRMIVHFPALEDLLSRVHTLEALVFSQSFPQLSAVSQLDLQPIFTTLLEVEKALHTKTYMSAEEALVEELASALVEPEPAEAISAKETPCTLEEMEKVVKELVTAIDVPAQEKLSDYFLAKPSLQPPFRGRSTPTQKSIPDLTPDVDIPHEKAWVPPGYPDVYEDIFGSWAGVVYTWVLTHEADPRKRSLGANLPNLPRILPNLLRSCGFLDGYGNPSPTGKYFIYQEKTGCLQFNREALPKLICTFLATNPEVDYRKLDCESMDNPAKVNVQAVQELAQRMVHEEKLQKKNVGVVTFS